MVLNGIRPHIQNAYRIIPEEMESGAPPILLPVAKGLLGWWILSSRTNVGFTILFVCLCFQQNFMKSLYDPGPALGTRAMVVNKNRHLTEGRHETNMPL